jgi:hypothetical protein
MNEPPCALSIYFHFIEGSNYENSLFKPIPQVNSDFEKKKKNVYQVELFAYGIDFIMFESFSYCEVFKIYG